MPAPVQGGKNVSASDALRSLEAVLINPRFRDCPRLASFLRFIVTMTLDGNGDRLKGYTIGVEALGRDESFDPQSDPIVRVEAVRLRRALARYYAADGARDPIVIELPRGGYVPVFHRRPPSAHEQPRRLVQAVRAVRRLLRMRITLQAPAEPL